jgi:diguanylate cyclase (GGDEF)-like protein
MVVGESCFQNVPLLTRLDLFDTLVSVRDSGLPAHLERYCAVTRKWYEVSSAKCEDGVTVHLRDITEKRRNAEQLKHDALHDGLTGLANRKAFEERLGQVLHRAQHQPDYHFAVLFLDFDRFKIINDSLGHDVGDELLINIGIKLRQTLGISMNEAQTQSPHLPARLGGDEFVILLDRIGGRKDVMALADKLLEQFRQPHVIGSHEVVSTASIGIVLSHGRYTQADEVLRDADTAMYRAKSAGKARYALFDESMHQDVMRRLTLERQLREAVEAEQFDLVYEPIVSLDKGRIIAFEALLRWDHPQLGLVPPAEFIPIAEELGLINRVGEWTLRNACAQLARWCATRPDARDLVVSVNLSRQQVLDPALFDLVRKALKKNNLSPKQLQIELTENTVMTDVEQMSRALEKLKALGVTLAMDDFGTGQSSLHSLHLFPIDVLKIDRSFIDTRDKDTRWWAAIIHATVELAHNLSMKVVAEGIELPEQLALLQGLSCDAGQGWLFAHAVAGDEAGRYLDRKRLLAEDTRSTAA